MDGKELYESLGAVCDALPVEQREEFTELIARLANSGAYAPVHGTANRWLRDAGWKR